MGVEIQEWIKCRSWVCIQKCFPQSRLADFADGQDLPLIPGITKTQFPVPSLEIIAKFSHFAAQANIEQIIVVSELFVSGAGVVDAAKHNPVVTGRPLPSGKKFGIVASATVKGLNGFWIGTLMPRGTKSLCSCLGS